MSHPVYLVCEADAGGRLVFGGPDKLRPLTAEGWRQAWELAERLQDASITRVISSPWLRCRQTVSPLANLRHLDVESCPALGEIACVESAMALVAANATAPTLVCSHLSLLQALVERLGWSGGDVRQVCPLAWAAVPAA